MSPVDAGNEDAANPGAESRAAPPSSALRVVPVCLRALPWAVASFMDGDGATPIERLSCRYQILLSRMPDAAGWHLPDAGWAIVPVSPSPALVEAAIACALDPDDPYLGQSDSPRATNGKGNPAGFARFGQQYAALVRLSRQRVDADSDPRLRVTDPRVAERIMQLSAGVMKDRSHAS